MIYLKAVAVLVAFAAIDTILATAGYLAFGERGFNIGFHTVGTVSSFFVAILIAQGKRWPFFRPLLAGQRL